MRMPLAIVALGALCCLFSGCGCSKEKPVDAVPVRMKDAAYTNQLAQLHAQRASLAAVEAGLREKIEKLGANAEQKPEFADLTNRLAQCRADSERLRREAMMTVRARIQRDAAGKGDLKK